MTVRLPLALALGLAPALRAQHAEVVPVRMGGHQVAEDALMGVAGLAVGVASAALVGSALDAAGIPGEAAAPLAIVAYPVGVASGVYGTGRLLGVDGSFRNALGDAALGTAIGVGAGAAVLFVYGAAAGYSLPTGPDDFIVPSTGLAVAVLLATVVAATVPVVWAVRDFRATPSLARAPTGETAAGVALGFRF